MLVFLVFTSYQMLSVLHRFATLATRMEQYIQGQSRDLVDQAYTKFVSSSLSKHYGYYGLVLCYAQIKW